MRYQELPEGVRWVNKDFELLRDPRRLRRTGHFWSVHVGRWHRALAKERGEGLVWFWIGTHEEYDEILSS